MTDSDERFMQRALELASLGEGHVEPNPMVGCVLVNNGEIIGEGFHQKFGGPHAEVVAIESAHRQAPDRVTGCTAYVTLEPCSHFGKTGPCTDALINAKVGRVVIATTDPNPLVSGKGIALLKQQGIEVEQGLLEFQSHLVLAPYLKKIRTGTPWVIAKWAMTLDGKIATETGDSKWISSEESRKIVHHIRGKVDGIVVGIGTALADNPRLDARPAGPRIATRIVIDSTARLSPDSTLVQTAQDIPVLIAVGPDAQVDAMEKLKSAGCQIVQSFEPDPNERIRQLLRHLGELGMTNLLVEGGGLVLGAFHDLKAIDEVHVFIAPQITGGQNSPSPIAGTGVVRMSDSTQLAGLKVQTVENDIYLSGRISI